MSHHVDFLTEVRSMPGGSEISKCIQCGSCSGSCPNANKMDFGGPRKVIAMVRAGLKDEVLSSNSMWYCSTCYLCTVRCPREIKPTEIMHVLESIAISSGKVNKKLQTPYFYKSFVDSVKANGRSYEFGTMLKYYRSLFFSKLKSNPIAALKMISLMGMLPFSFRLLSRGRMPLKATKVKDLHGVKAILKKAHALGSVE